MRTALTDPTRLAPTQPEHIPPPSPTAALTRDEDRDAYDTLRRRMVAQMRLGDVVEEVLVADYCDLVWEAARLRRVRARQLESLEHLGVANVLAPQHLTFSTHDLGERWAGAIRRSCRWSRMASPGGAHHGAHRGAHLRAADG